MSSANHLYFMSSANGLYFTSSANGRISRGRPRGMMLNWLRRWHEGITSTELNPVNQGLKYVESHGRLYHLVRHMMMMFSADMSNTFCIFLFGFDEGSSKPFSCQYLSFLFLFTINILSIPLKNYISAAYSVVTG